MRPYCQCETKTWTCEASLLDSPIANWLVRVAQNLEQAYARTQLLLTPSNFKARIHVFRSLHRFVGCISSFEYSSGSRCRHGMIIVRYFFVHKRRRQTQSETKIFAWLGLTLVSDLCVWLVEVGSDFKDGQSEIGPDAARRHGLFDACCDMMRQC